MTRLPARQENPVPSTNLSDICPPSKQTISDAIKTVKIDVTPNSLRVTLSLVEEEWHVKDYSFPYSPSRYLQPRKLFTRLHFGCPVEPILIYHPAAGSTAAYLSKSCPNVYGLLVTIAQSGKPPNIHSKKKDSHHIHFACFTLVTGKKK